MPKVPTAPPVEPVYPNLDQLDPGQGSGYRLTVIRDFENRLERERDERAKLHKKYRKAVNIIDGVDAALAASSMGMGLAGVGLLTTIIAAPVVVALEAAAVACGIAGIAGKYVSRRLLVKAKKHDEIHVLALSKLNSVADIISNSLRDGRISPDEFKAVLNEEEKYRQMKAGIQKKNSQDLCRPKRRGDRKRAHCPSPCVDYKRTHYGAKEINFGWSFMVHARIQ